MLRIDNELGFEALPRRWVGECTFGWLTRRQRLARDYEQQLDVAEAIVEVTMGACSSIVSVFRILKRNSRGKLRLPADLFFL